MKFVDTKIAADKILKHKIKGRACIASLFIRGMDDSMKYRCIKQYDSMDCAAACLASISWYYGKKISILEISEVLENSKEGTSVWDICRISEKLGLFASAYKKKYRI